MLQKEEFPFYSMKSYRRSVTSLVLLTLLVVSGFSALPLTLGLSNVIPQTSAASVPNSNAGGTHSYFGMMTKDGSVSTLESNYPSWQTYGGVVSFGPDGNHSGCAKGVTSWSLTLNTTRPNDVIVVVSEDDGGVSFNAPTDSAGLAWHERIQYNPGGGAAWIREDYAIASTVLSSDTITSNPSAAVTMCMTTFAVSGAYTLAPFDTNTGFVFSNASSTSAIPEVHVATNDAPDFVFGVGGTNTNTGETAGSGYTLIQSLTGGKLWPIAIWSEFGIIASPQSNLNVDFGSGSSFAMISDAIRETPGPSMDANTQSGLNINLASQSGSLFEYGLANSTAVDISTGTVLSFQMTVSPNYWGEVVVGSAFNTTNYSTNNAVVVFRDINGNAQIIQNGTILWAQNASTWDQPYTYMAAWSVAMISGNIVVYLNEGSGYQQIYDNNNFNWGFTQGYVYVLGATESTSPGTVSFAYLSAWQHYNPVAEGTADMNVWYLIRHYELITAGNYSGDAVILDTTAPPIWLSLSDGGVMYAGMAVGSTDCKVTNCQVGQTTYTPASSNTQGGLILGPGGAYYVAGSNASIDWNRARTQILDYSFCIANGVCPDAHAPNVLGEIAFVQINETSSQYSPIVYYTLNITMPPGPYPESISNYTVYFGTHKVTVSPTGSSTVSYITTYNNTFGFPGMRYVSRHITEVTGELFKELGYNSTNNDWADPLLNFMSNIFTSCQAASSYACPMGSGYQEYYSPMFPTETNNSQLLSDWYASAYAFPPHAYYEVQPNGLTSTFTIPDMGNQWADPYISRMSLLTPYNIGTVYPICFNGTSVENTAQQCWTYDLQTVGYDPTELALRAEYTANIGGPSSVAESLLQQTGWNGIGGALFEELGVGIAGVDNQSGLPATSMMQYHYKQTAYATYETDTILSAATAVAQYTGSQNITEEAIQAAHVLEGNLWSGIGSIVTAPYSVWLWDFTGGENSAYMPLSQGYGYYSNQGGVFGGLSNALQAMGYGAVQPSETAGDEPAATEATGLTAVALLNYVKAGFTPYPPSGTPYSQVPGLVSSAVTAPQGDWSISCSISTDCNYVGNPSGTVSFNTTSTQLLGGFSQPITLSRPIRLATYETDYYLNGTISTGSNLTLTSQLVDPVSSTVIASNNYTLYSGNYTGYLPVTTLVSGLKQGTYLIRYVIAANGQTEFLSNSGFIDLLSSSFTPNVMYTNFLTVQSPTTSDFQKGGWSQFGTGCNISSSDTTGLEISEGSGSCGVDNPAPIEGGFSLTATDTGSSTSTAAITIRSGESNYIQLWNGGGQIAVKLGTSPNSNLTYTAPQAPGNVSWYVTLSASGELNVEYATNGSAFQEITGFPGALPVGFFNEFSNIQLESLSGASYFYNIGIVGSQNYAIQQNSGTMNDYGQPWSIDHPQTSPTFNAFLLGNGSGSSYISSSATPAFDSIETIAFAMNPSAVGTTTSGSSSSYLVSDGNASNANWWFAYLNSGDIQFGYRLCVSGTCGSYTTDMGILAYATQTNRPYFIIGTFNTTSSELCLYVDGQRGSCVSVAGEEPNATVSLPLMIGNGLGSTSATQFSGSIYGLYLGSNVIADAAQTDQMLVQGLQGSPISGGYWYPLTNGNLTDLFGVGPVLSSTNATSMQTNLWPYFWSGSTWNTYYNMHPSPYTVSVDSFSQVVVSENSSVVSEPYIGSPDAGVMLAPVDLSQWNRSTPLMFSFNYIAASNYSGPTNVTNFIIQIYDTATYNVLYSRTVGLPYTTNTDIQAFSMNLQSIFQNQVSPPGVTIGNNIVIFVGVVNHWQTNWLQYDTFSNFALTSNQSTFYALSLSRYEPTYQGSDMYGLATGGALQIPNYVPPFGSFTMSMWFEPFNVTYGSGNATLFANDNTLTSNKGLDVFYTNNGTSLYACLGNSATEACAALTPSTTGSADIQSQKLYLVTINYNVETSALQLALYYPNGTAAFDTATITSGSIGSGAYLMSIGYNPATSNGFFPGIVSDFRVYSYSSVTLGDNLWLAGPTSNSYTPDSLWLSLSGSLADSRGSGITAIPVITSQWQENLVSFVAEP